MSARARTAVRSRPAVRRSLLAASVIASAAVVAVAGPRAPEADAAERSAIARASVGPSGEITEDAGGGVVSGDGRFVAFTTIEAISPDDANGDVDVYVRDLETGATDLVSRFAAGGNGTTQGGDDESYRPVISADGRFIAFVSGNTAYDAPPAGSLCGPSACPADLGDPGDRDIYVVDRGARIDGAFLPVPGPPVLVSVDAAGFDVSADGGTVENVDNPTMSDDGQQVAFEVQLDAGNRIVLRDRAAGTTVGLGEFLPFPVSINVLAEGRQQIQPALSADGRHLAYVEQGTGDGFGTYTVWVYDRSPEGADPVLVTSGAFTDTDVNGNPREPFIETASAQPDISADGSVVAYAFAYRDSSQPAPAAPFPQDVPQVIVVDRNAGTAIVASRLGSGAAGNAPSTYPVLSDDGRYVAFQSEAFNFTVTPPAALTTGCDVVPFQFLRIAGQFSAPGSPSTPRRGKTANAPAQAVATFPCNVYAVDRLEDDDTRSPRLVSHQAFGTAASEGVSARPAISADGRFVAFTSSGDDLQGGDTDDAWDVYVLEWTPLLVPVPASTSFPSTPIGGTSAAVGVGITTNDFGPWTASSITLSGTNEADFSIVDPNACAARSFHVGETCTVQARFSPSAAGVRNARLEVLRAARLFSSSPAVVSLSGSAGQPLVPGTAERVSLGSGGLAFPGELPGDSRNPAISADGRYVAFETDVDLDPRDVNGTTDIYVRDLLRRTTSIVSLRDDGTNPGFGSPTFLRAKGTSPTTPSLEPAISADGRFIAYTSNDLKAPEPGSEPLDDGIDDVFLVDRGPQLANGDFAPIAAPVNVRLVSVDDAGLSLNGPGRAPSLSGDGTQVAFECFCQDNEFPAVFVRDVPQSRSVFVNALMTDFGTPVPFFFAYQPAISADGDHVAFVIADGYLGFDSGVSTQVWVYDRDVDGDGIRDEADSGAIGFSPVSTNEFTTSYSGGPTLLGTQSLDPAIDGDGTTVTYAFRPTDDSLITELPFGISQIVVRDRAPNALLFSTTEIVSVAGSGPIADLVGDNDSITPDISDDGRYVTWSTGASNLDTSTPPTGVIGDRVWDDLDIDGRQDGGEPGVAGVAVRLLDGGGNVIRGQLTAADGTYAFTQLPAGTYRVEVLRPSGTQFSPRDVGGDTADSDVDTTTGQSAPITLTDGETDTSVDAGVFRGATIGDFVWLDVDRDGLQDVGEPGISGIVVELLDDLGQVVATTTSDTDGAYLFSPVPPGTYAINFVGDEVSTLTEAGAGDPALDSDPDDTTGLTDTFTVAAGDVLDTIDAGYIDPPNSISGRTWGDRNRDGLFQPQTEFILGGVGVQLLDDTGAQVGATIFTNFDTGRYSFDDVPAGVYQVRFVTPFGQQTVPQDVGFDDSIDSDIDPGTGLTSQVFLDFGVPRSFDAGYFAPATFVGRAFEDLDADGVQDFGREFGIGGVTVHLLDAGGVELATTTTAASGLWQFGDLTPGSYGVRYELPSGYLATTQNVGPSELADSDIDATTLVAPAVPVTYGAFDNDSQSDAGFTIDAISGNVFIDVDGDGVLGGGPDEAFSGLTGGITIRLLDGASLTEVSSTTTDATGRFAFVGAPPGDYVLEIVPPSGFELTSIDAGGSDELDSDFAAVDNRTQQFTHGTNTPHFGAGLYQLGSIGDRVWDDWDDDGFQDLVEPGLGGVSIGLCRQEDTCVPVGSTVSAPDGSYSFDALPPGVYRVTFTLPSGYLGGTFIAAYGESGTGFDSDPVWAGAGGVASVQLLSGQALGSSALGTVEVDAGVVRDPASFLEQLVTGDVWEDTNGDGFRQIAEVPALAGDDLSGVPITLVAEATGDPIATTLTLSDGSWAFPDPLPEDAIVTVGLLSGHLYSPTAAASGQITSTVSADDGTQVLTFEANGGNEVARSGQFLPVTIGGFVWQNQDNDFEQDATERGLAGLLVEILQPDNDVAYSTFTDADGNWSLPIPPGDYGGVRVAEAAGGFRLIIPDFADDAVDSDVDPTTRTSPDFTAVAGTDIDVDAGQTDLVDTDLDIITAPTSTAPGQTVTLELRAGTARTVDAFGPVTVTIDLPPGTTPGGTTATDWTCTDIAPVVCTYIGGTDDLPAGTNSTFPYTFDVDADAPSTLSFDLVLASGNTEVDPGDNTRTVTIAVVRSADVSVAVTAADPQVEVGDFTSVAIDLDNLGPTVVTGTTEVAITFPAGLTPSFTTGLDWDCVIAQTVTCTTSEVIDNGGPYPPLSISFAVAGTDAVPIAVVTAAVTSLPAGFADPAAGNDVGSAAIEVQPPPDQGGDCVIDPQRQRPTCVVLVVDRLAPGNAGGAVLVHASAPDGDSVAPSISGNGRLLVFETAATNLGGGTDGNFARDIILRELAPQVTVATPELDFPITPLGTTSAGQSVSLVTFDLGPEPLLGFAIEGLNPEDFTILQTVNCVPLLTDAPFAPVAPVPDYGIVHLDTPCLVSVAFRPTAAGERTATLVLRTGNRPFSTVPDQVIRTVTLRGGGQGVPTITINPPNVVFPDTIVTVSSDERTITITNTGTDRLSIPTLTLAGTNPGDFVIVRTTCAGAVLLPATSCEIVVVFRPTAPGDRSAIIRIDDSAAGSPHIILVTGRAPAPTLIANPAVTVPSRTIELTGANWAPNTVVTITMVDAVRPSIVFPERLTVTTDALGQLRTSLLIFPRSSIGGRLALATGTPNTLTAQVSVLIALPSANGPDFTTRS